MDTENNVSNLSEKLNEYQGQLDQVEELIRQAPNDTSLHKLRDDIKKLVSLTSDLLNESNTHSANDQIHQTTVGAVTVRDSNNGKSIAFKVGDPIEAKSVISGGNSFYPAILTEIVDSSEASKSTMAKVRYLGVGTAEEIPLENIRPLTMPQDGVTLTDLRPGIRCLVKYPIDGQWYPAKYEQLVPLDADTETFVQDLARTQRDYIPVQLVRIVFTAYNNSEIVPLQYVRKEKKKQDTKREHSVVTTDEPTEFEIPEHLRILATDHEAEKQRKRKKIKALKYKFKQQQTERITTGNQASWQQFRDHTLRKKRKKMHGFISPAAAASAVDPVPQDVSRETSRRRYRW